VTLAVGTTTIILLNSAHPLTRQTSNLALELAHIILRHGPTQAFFAPGGPLMIKEYNSSQKAEADCLAEILLAQRCATRIAHQIDEPSLATHFGVGSDPLRMRKNLIGAERQIGNRFSGRRSSPRIASLTTRTANAVFSKFQPAQYLGSVVNRSSAWAFLPCGNNPLGCLTVTPVKSARVNRSY
jgi:hypothetical protein